MGSLHELGFEVKPANALQRMIQAVGSSRAGAWLFSKTLYQPDKVLFKATGGRLTVPAFLARHPRGRGPCGHRIQLRPEEHAGLGLQPRSRSVSGRRIPGPHSGCGRPAGRRGGSRPGLRSGQRRLPRLRQVPHESRPPCYPGVHPRDGHAWRGALATPVTPPCGRSTPPRPAIAVPSRVRRRGTGSRRRRPGDGAPPGPRPTGRRTGTR